MRRAMLSREVQLHRLRMTDAVSYQKDQSFRFSHLLPHSKKIKQQLLEGIAQNQELLSNQQSQFHNEPESTTLTISKEVSTKNTKMINLREMISIVHHLEQYSTKKIEIAASRPPRPHNTSQVSLLILKGAMPAKHNSPR